MLLLSWIGSCLKESFEVLLESLFPEERFIAIASKEFISRIENLLELFGDMTGCSEDLELVLHFWQVVSRSGIKTLHLDSKRNEIIDNLLDDISDTVLLWAEVNWWVKNDITDFSTVDLHFLQVNPDIEYRQKPVMFVVRDANLVSKVAHRRTNTFCYSPDDKTVHIVNVREPCCRLLVWFNVLERIFQKLMDFPAIVLDVFKSGNY